MHINFGGGFDGSAANNPLTEFFLDVNAVPTAGTIEIWGIK
jgi:hypothetical protein